MAKGKSAKPGKTQSAARARSKTFAASGGNSAASDVLSPLSAPATISGVVIGHAAGEVWGLLSTNGPQTVAAIKKSVDAPPDVVLAGIGWLAREDKLEFETSGRTVKISLR